MPRNSTRPGAGNYVNVIIVNQYCDIATLPRQRCRRVVVVDFRILLRHQQLRLSQSGTTTASIVLRE